MNSFITAELDGGPHHGFNAQLYRAPAAVRVCDCDRLALRHLEEADLDEPCGEVYMLLGEKRTEDGARTALYQWPEVGEAAIDVLLAQVGAHEPLTTAERRAFWTDLARGL